MSPLRLLGPLSEKELRLASRRGRSYALRSGYLLLLCLTMLSTWYSIVGAPSNSRAATYGVSRAAVVSAYVVMATTHFQLVVAQLIAAVLLSSALGDEVGRSTLDVLLTTPITSGHIVIGKLVGGLLQVLLLLAVSLPALAVLSICVLIAALGSRRALPSSSYQAVKALWLLAFLRLAISMAGGIAQEKEGGSWQVLLTTPLPEGEILRVRATGTLSRHAVLLLSLLALQTCVLLFQAVPGEALLAGIFGLFRMGSVLFVLGAGLYFGVRLRTATLAVGATMVAFLGVNYLLAGSCNPLLTLLRTRLLRNAAQWNHYEMVVYYLSTMGTAFVLDVALGLFLWRRARRNVRLYVF